MIKYVLIRRRFEIVLAECGHWELAGLICIEMSRFVRAAQLLFIDLPLQFHECMQKRFQTRRATWNINIDGYVTINPLEDIVALLEWTAGNGARTHCNHVFRIGHLIVETYDLWRHFLGHRACDNHQIRLSR